MYYLQIAKSKTIRQQAINCMKTISDNSQSVTAINEQQSSRHVADKAELRSIKVYDTRYHTLATKSLLSVKKNAER